MKLKKSLGINENDFVIGIIARLEDYKDHNTFLQAAKMLVKNSNNN